MLVDMEVLLAQLLVLTHGALLVGYPIRMRHREASG
jgi:hypothetical protein